MKKYIFSRILRSLVSLFLVTVVVYSIIFTIVPRHLIFKQDPTYSKMAAEPDKKLNYENSVYERMGYINYMDSKELQAAAKESGLSVSVEVNAKNTETYQSYIDSLGKGWEFKQFPNSKAYYATREIPIVERVSDFYRQLIEIDHPWRIQDKSNPDLERYLRFENDPSAGFALVGSGTKHKYLLYFNGQFPYVHQNFVTLNLGLSYPTFQNVPVLDVITQGQGNKNMREVTFPNGQTKNTAVDIYSRTYRSPSQVDAKDAALYGKGDAYTKTTSNYKDPSMIVNSSIIGLIGVFIAYTVGLPLGAYMARFKNTVFDRVSTATLTFLSALPSIALIYVIRFVGGSAGLPDSFPRLGAESPLSYVLPAIILGIFSIPGQALWMRRYLIDQQLSDYVRFARAKGLTEKEITDKHIFKNAIVPIVVGIPTSIVMVIVGATLTETVFAFPGMGKMLIDAIKANNNNMVVGLTFIFSALSIFAAMAGDILMTIVDPRIKLTKKGGK